MAHDMRVVQAVKLLFLTYRTACLQKQARLVKCSIRFEQVLTSFGLCLEVFFAAFSNIQPSDLWSNVRSSAVMHSCGAH